MADGGTARKPPGRWYSLVPRGGAGLACDTAGVALGGTPLVHARRDAGDVVRCAVRPTHEVDRILTAAFGVLPDAVVPRLHRGLHRAARWIEAGDLCLASIETVMLDVPALTTEGMAKLAALADLDKGGAGWEDQPRVPGGQGRGGQWTADGGDGTVAGELASNPLTRLPLDDGVLHPEDDRPHLIPVGASEEDEPSRRSNGPPPDEVTSLEQVFPGLADAPGLAIPLAPVDGFLGLTGLADEANLEATLAVYRRVVADIKAVDPHFADAEILPAGGIAGLSWRERNALIDDLLLTRASALYRLRGEVGPLQVETLRFLQKSVDEAYAEGMERYVSGRLKRNLSREEAIGNFIDRVARQRLQLAYRRNGIKFGAGGDVTINNRDYNTSSLENAYTIPDARIGDISFDWTLTEKSISTKQVRGFFAADSNPRGVIIVRPTQGGRNRIYLIPRPNDLKR